MSVEILDMDQGGDDWFKARCGIPTCSEFHKVLAKGKEGGASIGRSDYLRRLAGEILTGEPAPEGYSNGFMERGKILEDVAREHYAFTQFVEPIRVGFIRNGRKGGSPDSLIDANGGLEIKTAIPGVHIARLQSGKLPAEHVAQVQGNLWVSEREWWDFVSFCPKLPPLIVRVYRDDAYIARLSAAVDAFTDELDALVASIRTYDNFKQQAAA